VQLEPINLLDLSDLSDLEVSGDYAEFDDHLELDEPEEDEAVDSPLWSDEDVQHESMNLGAPVIPPVIPSPASIPPKSQQEALAVPLDSFIGSESTKLPPAQPPVIKVPSVQPPVTEVPAVEPLIIKVSSPPAKPPRLDALNPSVVSPATARPSVRHGDDIAWEQAWVAKPASEVFTKYTLIFFFGVFGAWLVFS
jgi:hypothetical protein